MQILIFSTGFSSISHHLCLYVRFLILFHLLQTRFFQSTHLLMCLSLEMSKGWLTYSGGTDRPGEPCYNFSIPNDLTQMVNFPTWIPDCNSQSPAPFNLYLSSVASLFQQRYLLYSMAWGCCLQHLIKQNCLLKTF